MRFRQHCKYSEAYSDNTSEVLQTVRKVLLKVVCFHSHSYPSTVHSQVNFSILLPGQIHSRSHIWLRRDLKTKPDQKKTNSLSFQFEHCCLKEQEEKVGNIKSSLTTSVTHISRCKCTSVSESSGHLVSIWAGQVQDHSTGPLTDEPLHSGSAQTRGPSCHQTYHTLPHIQ